MTNKYKWETAKFLLNIFRKTRIQHQRNEFAVFLHFW